MRRTNLFLLVAIVFLVVGSVSMVRSSVHAQSSDTCSDTKLVAQIAADAQALGDSIKGFPSTGAGGVYSTMIDIANTRIKYEDMELPKDQACQYLVTETIILFANVGDYGLVQMGSKLGLDASMIAKNNDVVQARLEKQTKRVLDLIGPSATPTP